jgi:hypothetical protein
MSARGTVVRKRTSARRRKRSGKLTGRRLARLWPAIVALGLVGIVALVVSLTMIGGKGGQSQVALTPVSESNGASHAAPPRKGGPAIQFQTSSADLGQIPLDVPVSYAFGFANVGDDTLRIEGVDVKVLEGC